MAIQTVNIGASATTTYTSVGDSALTFMSLCNHGTNTITCDIHIVPNGQLPTNDNLLIKDLEIIAGDTFILYHGGEKILMANGDYVSVEATQANVISAISSYVGI